MDESLTDVTNKQAGSMRPEGAETKESKIRQISLGGAPSFRLDLELRQLNRGAIVKVLEMQNSLRADGAIVKVSQEEDHMVIEGVCPTILSIVDVKRVARESKGWTKSSTFLLAVPASDDEQTITIHGDGEEATYTEWNTAVVALNRLSPDKMAENSVDKAGGRIYRLVGKNGLTKEEKEHVRKGHFRLLSKGKDGEALKDADVLEIESAFFDIDWPEEEKVRMLNNYPFFKLPTKVDDLVETKLKGRNCMTVEIDVTGSTEELQNAQNGKRRNIVQSETFNFINTMKEWAVQADGTPGHLPEEVNRVWWTKLRGESVRFIFQGGAGLRTLSQALAVFDLKDQLKHVGVAMRYDFKIFAVGNQIIAVDPPLNEGEITNLHAWFKVRGAVGSVDAQDVFTPKQKGRLERIARQRGVPVFGKSKKSQ